MIWRAVNECLIDELPTDFLTRVARELLKSGTFRSTAEVIEGVRLADAMAGMRNSRPTLRELHDATLVEDYLVLLDGGPRWREILDRYEAEAILWPVDGVLGELATEVAGWQEVWRDDDWLVLCAPGHPAC